MKTLVISMLIFLTAFFSLIPASGQPTGENQSEELKEKPTEEPEHKKTADVNSIADANATADLNAVSAKIEEFEGLDEALEKIDEESKDEIRRWTRRTEGRLELALAVQKQITAEFNFLRELAIEEGAVKTTAAIDRILSDRQKRFENVIEKLEKEKERLRRISEREREREERERERSRERSREHPSRSK